MNNQQLSIHDLPASERPRERLLSLGASSLSNAELLAIILRNGTQQENVLHLSERILAQHQGLIGLSRATEAQLNQIHGLGKAKITQILAVIELARRVAVAQPEVRPTIHNATDAARLMMDMSHFSQEHIRVMLLDSQRHLIATSTVYVGTVDASLIRIAEIYREAITRNCPAIILAHNHPSGDPSPSPEDVSLTRDIIAAGRLLDIQLLDHIVIGHSRWCSLRELGLAFNQQD